jgi:uncharacterized protein YecA (UPF0149 family)
MATQNLVQLPVPDKLEPMHTKRSLMTNVRLRFFQLWNNAEAKLKTQFHQLMASVGNGDSVNKSRAYDRCKAVDMIVNVSGNDTVINGAKPGDILKCLSVIMRENGMGLRLRRREFQRLTHSPSATPAE